jgi:rod shape-determining protein MreC
VEPGQRVVTSGHSGTFPAGRPIGTVDSVVTRPGRSELRLLLRPAVPLYEIQHVFVLLSTPDPQRRALEERPIG